MKRKAAIFGELGLALLVVLTSCGSEPVSEDAFTPESIRYDVSNPDLLQQLREANTLESVMEKYASFSSSYVRDTSAWGFREVGDVFPKSERNVFWVQDGYLQGNHYHDFYDGYEQYLAGQIAGTQLSRYYQDDDRYGLFLAPEGRGADLYVYLSNPPRAIPDVIDLYWEILDYLDPAQTVDSCEVQGDRVVIRTHLDGEVEYYQEMLPTRDDYVFSVNPADGLIMEMQHTTVLTDTNTSYFTDTITTSVNCVVEDTSDILQQFLASPEGTHTTVHCEPDGGKPFDFSLCISPRVHYGRDSERIQFITR